MQRIGFKMRMKPGCGAEYKKRHDEIWPELRELLALHGARDYTIFLDEETNILFAINHIAEGSRPDELNAQPLMQKWFAHMGDIMDTNLDGTPVMIPIREVFHMD